MLLTNEMNVSILVLAALSMSISVILLVKCFGNILNLTQ